MAESRRWRRIRWRGLPLQLLFTILLPLAFLLLIVAFGGAVLHQQAMRTLVGERDERAARAAAAAIGEQLNHRALVVRGLALRASAGTEPAQALDDIAPFTPDFDGGLALFAPDGSLLAATGPADWAVLAPAVADVAVEGTAAFSPVLHDPELADAVTLVVAAEEGYVAAGAFFPTAVIRRALNPAFGAGDAAAAFVVAADGTVLYQLGTALDAHGDPRAHPGAASALRGESGTTYLTMEGQEHILAFSPVPPTSWALVIEESWHAVSSPLLRLTEWAPLVLAPLLIVTLIGLGFGVRQIVQPLQALSGRATALAWGDFEAIEEPVGGIAEIQRLQTELAHMAAKIQAAQRSMRGYLGAVTAGQEEERRRLARELHDDTIQALIALNQRLQLVQMAQPETVQITEMQQMVAGLIADLRRTIHALRPIYLEDLGLVPALQMLVQEMQAGAAPVLTFECEGKPSRLEPEVELALYRIAQEALSNVVRHADASAATVRLTFRPETVALMVSDDGTGFTVPESPAELAPQAHFGLLGIHERAELIGARLMLASQPGRGTRVEVTVVA
ncbi:MAG: histidine kinase [Anaerolineae bacterium]|nr:histidine kinase [Anaerolineae bacterium]